MERNSREFQAIMRVHEGLPRQGPGSIESTAYALSLLLPIPQRARIYDLGCGPGHASLVLAKTLQQKVVAIDLSEEFLLQLKSKAVALGLSALIEARQRDMIVLDDAADSIDMIWAEGSIYCVGFDNALRIWQPLLAGNGVVACTELSWLTDHPSIKAAQFWSTAYPAARSVIENITAAERLGFKHLDHFVLPASCWWDEYYDPMLRNIERLKPEAEEDNYLAEAITCTMAEIDLFRHCANDYGYVFYLLQKSMV
jgi:SAM-dependent methyltransferase